MDAAARFDELVEALHDAPGVTPPEAAGRSGFGSTALKVRGRIFAMVVGGALVLKLPRARVEELCGDGRGAPFVNGKGQPMREWVVLTQDRGTRDLGREALAFVGAQAR